MRQVLLMTSISDFDLPSLVIARFRPWCSITNALGHGIGSPFFAYVTTVLFGWWAKVDIFKSYAPGSLLCLGLIRRRAL